MDRAAALANLNGRMLVAFSARTVAQMRSALPLRIALPHLERLLALNVQKEVRKDALVIRRAAAAAAETSQWALVRSLYGQTRNIDEEFVRDVGDFPLRVIVPYAEIEPLRIERIQRLMIATASVLDAWRRHDRLRDALRSAYGRTELESTLRQIMELYARETRVLTRSVRLPLLLEPVRERIAQHLVAIMTSAGASLAADVARGVHTARSSSSLNARYREAERKGFAGSPDELLDGAQHARASF